MVAVLPEAVPVPAQPPYTSFAEPPETVAQMFGIERNNVDQIKSRLIARLARLVKAMTA